MQQPELKKLLNDESFIRWLNEEATIAEQQKWDHWLIENHARQHIAEKARKIATMPFTETNFPDIEQELRTLKKEIRTRSKKGQ